MSNSAQTESHSILPSYLGGVGGRLDVAKIKAKKIPTQKKSELGIVIGKLELLLELHYYLIPNFCIKKSATSYCCL